MDIGMVCDCWAYLIIKQPDNKLEGGSKELGKATTSDSICTAAILKVRRI